METVKTKKRGKKKKKLRKRRTVRDVEEQEQEEEEEEAQKPKKERDEDDQPTGCCQFCFWNFREGHRCLSFFSYYNMYMTRPVRWAILVMSWYLFMTFSGLFIGGNEVRKYIYIKQTF